MAKWGPRYSEEEARRAISEARSYSEALRKLGMRAAGGNHATLRRYANEVWHIPVDHFDPYAAVREGLKKRPSIPLSEVLVMGSTYSRRNLKLRLYDLGLKRRECELCGQGERWNGRWMSLILDHVNGVADDNRLENLQIVCPNCAATLDTHCGRNSRLPPGKRRCAYCAREFMPKRGPQRYCSPACGRRWDRSGRPLHKLRRVQRPPYEQLLEELVATSYSAVGRKYGVSDNAIRKWIRSYERERTREDPSDLSEPA